MEPRLAELHRAHRMLLEAQGPERARLRTIAMELEAAIWGEGEAEAPPGLGCITLSDTGAVHADAKAATTEDDEDSDGCEANRWERQWCPDTGSPSSSCSDGEDSANVRGSTIETVQQQQLFKAVREGDVDSTKEALSMGAVLSGHEVGSGKTALHYACDMPSVATKNSMDNFKLMLRLGANVHALDEAGCNPLDTIVCAVREKLVDPAVHSQCYEMMILLLENGCTPTDQAMQLRSLCKAEGKIATQARDPTRLQRANKVSELCGFAIDAPVSLSQLRREEATEIIAKKLVHAAATQDLAALESAALEARGVGLALALPQKALLAALRQRSATEEAMHTAIQHDTVCKICMEEIADCGFLHAMTLHVCACCKCAQAVEKSGGSCPLCRQQIEELLKIERADVYTCLLCDQLADTVIIHEEERAGVEESWGENVHVRWQSATKSKVCHICWCRGCAMEQWKNGARCPTCKKRIAAILAVF